MRLAFSTLGCPGLAIADVADVAARHGFSGVELRAAPGEPVHLGLEPAGRRDVVTALQARHVDVLALASYVRVADPAADDDAVVADGLAHGGLAADLGASYLRVFPGGRTGTDAAQDLSDAAAVRRLLRLRDGLAGYGVAVALETHDSHPAGTDVARILDQCPGVLAIWDALHPWRAGEAPADTARSLSGRLAYAQVKDVASADDLAPLPPGTGALPLAAMADALRSNGYRGAVSWEYERAWFPDATPLPDLAGDVAEWMRARFRPG
jgi:sugar phosphate isomerase/epimerase